MANNQNCDINIQSDIITFSYKEIAKALGYPLWNAGIVIDENEYYYLRLRKPFRLLKENYSLLEYKSLRDKKVVIKQIQTAQVFILPFAYWDYGYSTLLSFKAKYAYLICLMEQQKEPGRIGWQRSHKGIAYSYHISANPISLGLLELEKYNIVEIARSRAVAGEYAGRDVNIYRMNNLLPEEEFRQKLDELEKKYSRIVVNQALFLSGQLNEPRDIEKTGIFAGLIKKYGYTKTAGTNRITMMHKKGTALFSIENTIGLLEMEGP